MGRKPVGVGHNFQNDMSEKTNISWCDSTWNWSRGCDKVSPGCKNCYITTTVPFRTSGQKHGDPRVTASDATFNAPITWNKKPWVCVCGKALRECLAGRPECSGLGGCGGTVHRRRVFSLSLGDWLDPKIDVAVLARALDIIRRCDQINFLLLTKRIELFRERLARVMECSGRKPASKERGEFERWMLDWEAHEPPHNVWIGASVEDKPRKSRIDILRSTPAAVRFLSCEPLLEDLGDLNLSGIDWVIVGGESGTNARLCNVEWIRSIVRQCKAANVPVLVKQLGKHACQDLSAAMPEADITDENADPADIAAWEYNRHHAPLFLKHKKGGDPDEWPEDLRVQEFPSPAE